MAGPAVVASEASRPHTAILKAQATAGTLGDRPACLSQERMRMSATVAESLVSRVEAALGPLPAPSQLQAMIEEHREHVLTLAAAVLGSGRDVAFVGQLVDNVLRSYRDELIRAIMALPEGESAG
jgi:hypothetical protein